MSWLSLSAGNVCDAIKMKLLVGQVCDSYSYLVSLLGQDGLPGTTLLGMFPYLDERIDLCKSIITKHAEEALEEGYELCNSKAYLEYAALHL